MDPHLEACTILMEVVEEPEQSAFTRSCLVNMMCLPVSSCRVNGVCSSRHGNPAAPASRCRQYSPLFIVAVGPDGSGADRLVAEAQRGTLGNRLEG